MKPLPTSLHKKQSFYLISWWSSSAFSENFHFGVMADSPAILHIVSTPDVFVENIAL